MKLRELINRLEELSENGENDDFEVLSDELGEILDAELASSKHIFLIIV